MPINPRPIPKNDVDDWTAVNLFPDSNAAGRGMPKVSADDSDWTTVDLFAKPEEPVARTIGGTIKDIGVSVAKGVIGLGEAAVGLADIPTFGIVGKTMEGYLGYDPKKTQEFLGEFYSPVQKKAFGEVEQAVGFLGTIKESLKHPSTIGHYAIESFPLMLGGASAARGLLAIGMKSPLLAGAIGEGIVSAGAAAEQTRQQTEDGLLTAKQALIPAISGAGTAMFALVGGLVAQKLGIIDVDTFLAGGSNVTTTGVIKRIIGGGITEGAFEELPQSMQEQVWLNAALDKPLLEGVPEAGATGMLAGAAMGAGFNIFTGGVAGDPTARDELLEDYEKDATAKEILTGREEAKRVRAEDLEAEESAAVFEDVGTDRATEDAGARADAGIKAESAEKVRPDLTDKQDEGTGKALTQREISEEIADKFYQSPSPKTAEESAKVFEEEIKRHEKISVPTKQKWSRHVPFFENTIRANKEMVLGSQEVLDAEEYKRFWSNELTKDDYLKKSAPGLSELRKQLKDEEDKGNIKPEYVVFWEKELNKIEYARQSQSSLESLRNRLAEEEKAGNIKPEYVVFWEKELNKLENTKLSSKGISDLGKQLSIEESEGNIQPEYANWWKEKLERLDQVRQSIIGKEGLMSELSNEERSGILSRKFEKTKKIESKEQIKFIGTRKTAKGEQPTFEDKSGFRVDYDTAKHEISNVDEYETAKTQTPKPAEPSKQEATEEAIKVVPIAEGVFKKPISPKPSKVRTLRGAIKELGGIDFLNYTGELKDLEVSVKKSISKKGALGIDQAVDELIADGWLDKDATVSSFLEALRTDPKGLLSRDRIGVEIADKKPHELSAREKRLKEEMEYEAEAPPGGSYVTLNAEDLPVGKKMTLLEDKTASGWDTYEIIEKDSFGITLKDGNEITLSPLDKVQVLKKDIKDVSKVEVISPDGTYVDRKKTKSVEKDGLKATYYGVYRKDGAFKSWLTKAEIEKIKADKGKPSLTLKQESYGKQAGTKPVDKMKQQGLGLEVEDKTQPSLFEKKKEEPLSPKPAEKPSGIAATYKKRDGVHIVEVADEKGNVFGKARFVDKSDGITIQPGSIFYVEPKYRRQGISTRLFEKAEEITGKEIIRTGVTTPTGSVFYDAWFSKKDEKKKEKPYEKEKTESTKVKAVKPQDTIIRKDFQERVIAGQDLIDEIKSVGRIKTINPDGTVTLYHGTSPENAKIIKKEGLKKQSYLSLTKKETLGHIQQYDKKEIIEINVDARDVEFSSGTQEIYIPDGLVLGEDRIWKSPERMRSEIQFSTKTGKPQDILTRKDLKDIFEPMKNIRTGINKAGNLYFGVQGRPAVEILEVDHVDGYIQVKKGDDVERIPVGSYLHNTIKLKTGGKGHTADINTAFHEFFHYISGAGVLTNNDIKALDSTIGKENVTEEDRATYVGNNLADWHNQNSQEDF